MPIVVRFDSKTQSLKELTQDQNKGLTFWIAKATNKRKADRKTDIVTYVSAKWEDKDESRTIDSNNDK